MALWLKLLAAKPYADIEIALEGECLVLEILNDIENIIDDL